MKQNESSLLHDKLKEYFGFSSFKGNQEAVIRNVLEGNDTFVLMPTGGGKSLCYQLPALIMDGVAIVISPLIALMKNQVDAMRTFSADSGIAHFLNSSLNKTAVAQVRADVLSGKTKLLYFAPESLTKEDNVAFLHKIKVSFYAIDEAHCISQWGYDFRPSYLRIAELREKLPGVPVLTLLEVGRVKVRFSVPELEIARLGADSRIGVGVAALGDRVFPAGKIEKGAVANPAAHTYDVRATLDNAAGELLPGMVCRVTVSPAESAEEIAVPLRAVQQAGDGSRFVWTVRGDSAVRTAVTTGRLVNNGIVLTGGVAAGDRIVVDGMQKIGEGSKVVW